MFDQANQQKIKEMTELGFAAKRIAYNLKLDENEVRALIKTNNWELVKETFSISKKNYIVELYESGVSAKQLGKKYNIGKAKVQKWAQEKGILRNQSDALRYHHFNQAAFDNITTPEQAYWLGMLYADAYNCEITWTVSLTLKKQDLKHIQKFCQFMEYPIEKINENMEREIDGKIFPAAGVQLYAKYLCQALDNRGCMQAKSFKITYPTWLDSSLNNHFIRGLFDGDGSLCMKTESKEWVFSLASTEMMCEGLQTIFNQELNMIINYHNISKTGKNTCNLSKSGNVSVLKVMDWIYSNSTEETRLDRKYEKYLDLQEQQANRTFSKNEYKVSDEKKEEIAQKLNDGVDIRTLADEYKLHSRTIRDIKSNNLIK